MKSKQNRTLKEFDSLYKMIDDVYHEIALSMHLTDSAFLILYCLLELGDGCSQKDICKLYSISKQTINSSVKSLENKGFLTRRSGAGRDRACSGDSRSRLAHRGTCPCHRFCVQ